MRVVQQRPAASDAKKKAPKKELRMTARLQVPRLAPARCRLVACIGAWALMCQVGSPDLLLCLSLPVRTVAVTLFFFLTPIA